MLVNQVNNLINDLPSFMGRIEGKISDIMMRLENLIDKMPRGIKKYMLSIKDDVNFDNSLLSGGGSFKIAKTTIISVTNMFLYMIFTIMSAYYFTADRDSILCRIRLCMPGYMMTNIRGVMQNFKQILGGYLIVQVKLMFILITVLYLGLSIFRIKYAFICAVVIGVLDLLPLLGIGVVLIPWALGAFILNEVVLGIELIVLYLICVTIREIAEPKMFGKSIGLSSYATFFLLYIGLKLGGVIGAILVIPLGMIVINLYKIGAFKVLIEDIKYLYYEVGRRRREIDEYIINKNHKRM
jgi:sporulation integral membrane protein YtvI